MDQSKPTPLLDGHSIAQCLARPDAVFSRSDVLTDRSLVPATRGLYGWFFREVPPHVPVSDCERLGDLTLLYVGISPKSPASQQNLRKRIRYHFRGNAEGSTLRQTLGVLLTEQSQYPLRRVGSGKRMTFTHLGEQWLDAWMNANALVTWIEHPEPWAVEAAVFARLSLPLNLQDNKHHPFQTRLSAMRVEAKKQAAAEPVASEHNQRRAL